LTIKKRGYMREITLTPAQAASATLIQNAIDSLGDSGGRVILPEIDLILDRGIELRSNVELVGQGEQTILRKAPGRVYPLSGYHNYGMLDVPLMFTDGLEPGMTVAIRDDRHGGFFETFSRITWVDGTWVGLDTGLHSDYHADLNPVLLTSFPLVYGLGVENIAVRNLCLDGNRKEQPAGIGGCRGAAVYFIKSSHIEVSGVKEEGYEGEGLGFQMCKYVTICNCHFANNSGNGYHPGAGSTAVMFENCIATANDAAGFFFCVRANHITVKNCTFKENTRCGISVGTRDSYNLIDSCRIFDNAGPGILFRAASRPVEVRECRVTQCHITGNSSTSGWGQIDVLGDAHDLVFERNVISGLPDRLVAGIYLASSTEHIWLEGNQIQGCSPAVIGGERNLASAPVSIKCGLDAVEERYFRHLTATE
jgi:parallel beta-helix repeat protein